METTNPRVLRLLGGQTALAGMSRPVSEPQHVPSVAEELPSLDEHDGETSLSMDPQPLTFVAAEVLASNLQEPVSTIQRLLRLTNRTWARRRADGVFSTEESDHLYRIARVVRRAIDVFGTEEKARSWLTRPNRTMRVQRPLDLLGSDQGASIVADELARIDYGDLY